MKRAILVVVLLCGAAAGGYVALHLHHPSGAKPLGGNWLATDPQSHYGAGHTSPPFTTLYRRRGAWYTEVSSDVLRLRYYEPDCVVFQGILPVGMVWAACGDRSPVAIVSSTSDFLYKFESEGLVDYDVGAVFVKPAARVIALAEAQPRYRSGWSRPYADARNINAIPSFERPYQPGDSARPPR